MECFGHSKCLACSRGFEKEEFCKFLKRVDHRAAVMEKELHIHSKFCPASQRESHVRTKFCSTGSPAREVKIMKLEDEVTPPKAPHPVVVLPASPALGIRHGVTSSVSEASHAPTSELSI